MKNSQITYHVGIHVTTIRPTHTEFHKYEKPGSK